jgi:predicted  nucleic acid-binding Zn-ribbon protein
MYFVLGLLAAGLLALAVAPAMLRRAARLTRARVEGSLPLSMAEIRADKDQLRAEFAVSARRLELTARRLEEKAAEQAVEISRRSEEVARLSREHAARTTALGHVEGRVVHLATEIADVERKLAEAHVDLAARDEALAERAKALAALTGDFEAAQQLIEEQQLEVVAGNTRIGNLSDQLAVAKGAEAAAGLARDGLATELAGERGRREALAADIARLETERAERVAELSRRAEESERLRSEMDAAAIQRRGVEDRLGLAEAALAAARGELAELRRQAGADSLTAGDNLEKAVAASEAEKTALAARLAAIEDEYATLRAENAELRRVGGAEWEAERAEHARLRERLVAVAADVVHMTQAMAAGKAGSPQRIEDGNGAARKLPVPRPLVPRAPADTTDLVPGDAAPRSEARSLAERIRALQQSSARH